jgi:8-oxo-dGTP pyrophosphatase MutT (NUDIX family)
MGHLNVGAGEHDLTASAIVLREDATGMQVVLHRHKTLGMLLQPGGHVERSENPWQAVLREVAEETGLTGADLHVIETGAPVTAEAGVSVLPQPLCVNVHPIGSAHFHTDIVWAFLWTGDSVLRPAPGEAQEVAWFSVRDVMEGRVQSGPGVRGFTAAACERSRDRGAGVR